MLAKCCKNIPTKLYLHGLKKLTSCVGIHSSLVVLSQMIWDSRNNDDPVAIVCESFIVATGQGRISTDGRSGCNTVACASINQGLHRGSILKKLNFVNVKY